MENRTSIRVFLRDYEAGKFDSPGVKTQTEAGWFDWFCQDKSLARKTENLVKKLKRIVNSPLINKDTQYVWFKNNCPLYGHLYDDFRIADLWTGDVIWTITPSSGHDSKKGKAELWGKINNFEGPVVEGSWKDIVNYFNNQGVA